MSSVRGLIDFNQLNPIIGPQVMIFVCDYKMENLEKMRSKLQLMTFMVLSRSEAYGKH